MLTRDWIRTFTGKQFCPTSPRPEDLCIEDVAHHLSLINRYTGATKFPFSVAQHSVYVSELVPPDLALCGLLHDGPEFCLNDINRPVKYGAALDGYRELEEKVWQCFALKWNLPERIPPAVKAADDYVGRIERNCLNERWPKPEGLSSLERTMRIPELEPAAAEAMFLKRFKELTDRG